MLTLFLSSFLLAWGNPPTEPYDVYRYVEGNSLLVIHYGLHDLNEGDFVYMTVECEYYDPKTSQWHTIIPNAQAITGANDHTYIQVEKKDRQLGIIKEQYIYWDLSKEPVKYLYADSKLHVVAWTISRENDKDLWKILKKEKRLTDNWLKAKSKNRCRRAARLENKVQQQRKLH